MIALIDTNIYLDTILERMPFAADAEKILTSAELGGFDGFCCATTVTDIFYIVQKAVGAAIARQSIAAITRTSSIAAVTEETIKRALASATGDFEDAVVIESAVQVNAKYIVTRNPKDFQNSPVSVISPPAFLALLRSP